MNHGFKLHPDGTLEITMPKGKKVGRVLVCEAGTCIGRLYYPDCDDCIKHGGEWECDHVNCHKGKDVPDSELIDWINECIADSHTTQIEKATLTAVKCKAEEIIIGRMHC